MADMCTPRRKGRAPLRPVTPMGVDLPEDTPSKIRARSAAECAGIRRLQEEKMAAAELETGQDLHAQLLEQRTTRAAAAKVDAGLRRDLLVRQTDHKRTALQLEADRERLEVARLAEEHKSAEALKKLRKLEREAEKKEAFQSRLETISHLRVSKAKDEARERSLVAQEYASGLTERRLKEEEAKKLRKEEADAKRAAILEAREMRVKERALAAAALRAELEESREAAKVKEAERIRVAEEQRETIRARADVYRKDKELAKTSAFAR